MALTIDTPGFRDSLVILGAAGLVIPAFARFRISPVIGFILIGLAVGPAGLGSFAADIPWLNYVSISNRDAIEPFAELGIIMLLFSVGLELSFKRLWDMRALVFGLGAAELIISGLALAVIIHLIGQPWTGAIGLGLALALSSTALVLPITGTRSPVGKSALAMLLFEDMALVPIIFVLGVLAPHGGESGWSNLVWTLWVGGLTVALMLLLGRKLLPPLFAQAARTKSPELFLAASLVVVIGASAATVAAGLSPIVGALIAGLIIAETEYRAEVEATTQPLRGLGLGVFLITVGMSLDVRLILANWPSLLLAVVGVLLLKAIITSALLRLGGARSGVAAHAGVLMASPSETTLIVLAAAQSARVIAPGTASFWTIITAVGLTATPFLARLGDRAARRIERLTGEDSDMPSTRIPDSRAIIVGFGRVGRLVAQMLERHGKPYVAVDADIDTVRRARREGYPMIFGDVARPAFLEQLHLDTAMALILTMDDPVQVVRTTARVRRDHPDLCIIARARDAGHAAELYRAGASDAVPETLEASLQLSEAALVDLGVAMGPVIASIHEKRAELREEIMQEGNLEREPRLQRRKLSEAGELD